MKKFASLLLALVMCLCCLTTAALAERAPVAKDDLKIGFIFLHDENSTYDLNFITAAKAACEKLGIAYETKTNIPEGQECYDAAAELADAGCNIIFADSFGHESYMIQAALEFPEVEFCHSIFSKAHTENLPNYHNAFATIYEGRYLAGVAAGMKLNEMIDAGTITADQAKIGYVGAYPYAEVVSQNIVRACASVGVLLSRYQRPEQLSDLRHPLLHVVGDLNEACAVARRLGERILLTTGSKDLAAWRAGLAEKTMLARVLPVPEVVQHCSDLGFGVGEIFALCGPFSAEFNAAFYRQCRADVVVTKASGAEGGYQEKVQPCLDAGIPCIVITRPAPLVTGDELLQSQADFTARLTRWLSAT